MNNKLNAIFYGVLFSGLGMFSYLLLVNYTDLPHGVSEALYSVGAIVYFLLAFNIVGYATIRLSSWVNNQYVLNIQRRTRLVMVYAAVVLMFFILNYGLLIVAKLLVGAPNPLMFPHAGLRIIVIVWLVELVVLVLGLLLANKSMQNALRLQQQALELQQESNRARYAALQSQLNPHFLFNSLNTLIAEIEYDPKNAVGFTKNLSDVYRYVLQCQDKPLVSLGEELNFVKAYMFLHEVRLGSGIKWHSNIPDDYMESLLPPLTLQLLVENVIKHNSIAVGKPMNVDISIDADSLIVSNTINRKRSSDSSGVGLENLSTRCRLMLGRDISITDDGRVFTVKVPLLYE